MAENNVFNEENDGDLDILGFLYKQLRYGHWFIISLTISYIGAYFYLEQYTPIYKVNATLLIKDENSNKKVSDVVDAFSSVGVKQMDNEIEVLRSRTLMARVIDALNLTVSYWREGRSRDMELYGDSPIKIITNESAGFTNGSPFYIRCVSENRYQLLDTKQNFIKDFDFSQLIKSPYGQFRVFRNKSVKLSPEPIKVIFQSREGLVGGLAGGIQIAPLNYTTSFISLSIETALPDKGKAILGKLLEEYAYASLEDKNRESTNTLRFIEERLKLVSSELGDVEQNVEQYKRTQGITDLSSEASLFLGKVEENDTKLNELEIQAKVLLGVEGYINNSEAGNLAPATLMVNDPVLSGYISQYTQLESERAKLARSVQPGNPLLETINGQMRNVKQAIRENISNQKTNIEVNRNNLVNLNNRLESSISTIPRKEREYVGIKRQAGIKENLYLLLFQKREETALSYSSTVTDSRVVDMPYDTGGPIKPNRRFNYMLALLIGLGTPFFLITIKVLLTTTVQSKNEIERKTGLKVFGKISLFSKENESEMMDVNNRSFVSEQIRMIRSNLQYLIPDKKDGIGSTILLTSSTSGEGKSFITLNIAASLSYLDKKVVIIGLDLRKPKIFKDLEVEKKKGVSNYLIGRAEIDEIIQKTKIENLFMITSGPIPPNPSELISNGRIKELLEVLKHKFDYILIDTPPYGLVTDATLLAAYTDVCFYIVRHENTPKHFLTMIRELNAKNVFKSINIIFNAVNHKSSSEYGYGYGYGKGYYEKETRRRKWYEKIFSKKMNS